MFTGIIAAVGHIQHIAPQLQGVRAAIACAGFSLDDVALGDSIACNGVCLTVVEKSDARFGVDISQETLRCSVGLDQIAAEVNLEKAMRLSDRLGGHLVSGHVDAVGEVVLFKQIGTSWELQIRLPDELAKFVAPKGSITIDGVSLTVNHVEGTEFSINIIPHTFSVTSLKRLAVGVRVNTEVDLIARYLAQLIR